VSEATAGPESTAEPTGKSPPRRIAWHCRNNPKRELWFAWYTTVIFYNFYFIVFFPVTHAQPPPHPYWSNALVANWFGHNHRGLVIGFAIIFAVAGMTAAQNALIAYSMRRMSVSRAFAWSYLVLYSVATIPGLLLLCVALSVGALRPARDPALLHWLYDLGLLSFTGTMGLFLIGSLIWMLAILLDRNRVLPKWFGYLNLCNALTEVVVAPAWIFHAGVFSWNGLVSWWVDIVVFGIYTGAFLTQLRTLILREDFGDGPLPELKKSPRAAAASLAGTAP